MKRQCLEVTDRFQHGDAVIMYQRDDRNRVIDDSLHEAKALGMAGDYVILLHPDPGFPSGKTVSWFHVETRLCERAHWQSRYARTFFATMDEDFI